MVNLVTIRPMKTQRSIRLKEESYKTENRLVVKKFHLQSSNNQQNKPQQKRKEEVAVNVIVTMRVEVTFAPAAMARKASQR